MKTTFKIAAIALLASTMIAFTSCGDSNNNNNNNGGETEQTTEQKIKAAFAQFGLDSEQVKPNVATPFEQVFDATNIVSDNVYYRRAFWLEMSETEIDAEVGHAYNERMFDYMKSVAADGKIYQNGENPVELESYQAFLDSISEDWVQMITWSYKYNGMWVIVYMDFSEGSDEIGLDLGGGGNY